MNCGLGNLNSLKTQLLTPALQPGTQFDSLIQSIGRGVAGSFDQFCNRAFTYKENFTEIFMGNRAFWYARRFPFVTIAKVELKYFQTDAWTDITAQPLIVNPETGQLNFGYTLGPAPLQCRITYTGGYWFQMLEPTDPGYQVCDTEDDPGYPSALPTAIQNSPTLNPPGIEPFKFLLPRELRDAWLLQCRVHWDSIDKLGLGVKDKPKAQSAVNSLELAPQVKQILKSHIRYQLT